MRARHVAVAVVLLGAVSACGGRENRDRENHERDVGTIYEPGVGGRGLLIRPGVDPNAIYSDAIDLKAKGDCAGAAVKLRRVVVMGPGYENAQTALGECLMQDTQGAEPSSAYLEGIVWLRRAANAGWPEAQALLAVAYASGPGTVRDGEEAAYWLILYDANPGKSRIGFKPLPAATLDAARKSLSAAVMESAARRAATWQRRIWLPLAEPTADRPDPGPTRRRTDERRRAP